MVPDATEGLCVLIAHHEAERYLGDLQGAFPEIQFYCAASDQELEEQMERYRPQVLLSFRCDPISTKAQSVAVRKPWLQWVQVGGAGHDHLGDLAELACPVTSCAGVLSKFQAETVLGAMINLNFGFLRYQKQQRQGIYRKLPWRSLAGQKLLLIGLGHIGRAVARNARYLGMEVTAVRLGGQASAEVDAVFGPEQLPSLLPEADFVSLHLPYSAESHHFFDAGLFAAMKESAFFINTARGNLVDEEALIVALRDGGIAGAYLDVFSQEPLPHESPLWHLENVLLSPHYCDSVQDWQGRFADFFAANLRRWLVGEDLQNRLH